MRSRDVPRITTHHSKPARWAASLLLPAALAIATVGCSSSAQVSPATADPSATLDTSATDTTSMCGLFSGSELSDLFGQDFSAGAPDPDVSDPNCRWEGTVPSQSQSGISGSVAFKVATLDLTPAAQALFDKVMADKLTRVVETPAGTTVQECFVDHVGSCSTYNSTLYLLLGDRYAVFDISNYATPADFTDEQVDGILAQAAALAGPRLAG